MTGSAVTSSTRGRPRQFEESKALTDALGVFREMGFEGAGTDRLAEAMGMKKQSVYRTFGNKSDLFDRCFDVYLSKIKLALDASFKDKSSLSATLATCLCDAARYFHASQTHNQACLIIVIAPACPDKQALSQHALTDLEIHLQRLLAPLLPNEESTAQDLSTLLVTFMQSLAIRARAGASLEDLLDTCRLYEATLLTIARRSKT